MSETQLLEPPSPLPRICTEAEGGVKNWTPEFNPGCMWLKYHIYSWVKTPSLPLICPATILAASFTAVLFIITKFRLMTHKPVTVASRIEYIMYI